MNFRSVTLDDLPRLRALYAQCAEHPGDISPMLCFGYGYSMCEAQGLLWLRQPDGIYLPPMGDWQRTDWRAVFEACVPAQTTFFYIPEALLTLWQAQLGDRIAVTEDRGMWDYILDTAKMASAAGSALSDYRRQIHHFERSYPDSEITEITEADLPEIAAFDRAQREALEARATVSETIRADVAAFDRILPYFSHPESHLHGLCLRIGGTLAAIALGEYNTDAPFTAFYKRCDYAYKGVNAYITRAYAKMQLSLGAVRTNLMQDENEPNLRAFKEGLHPLLMLRKSAVTYF